MFICTCVVAVGVVSLLSSLLSVVVVDVPDERERDTIKLPSLSTSIFGDGHLRIDVDVIGVDAFCSFPLLFFSGMISAA